MSTSVNKASSKTQLLKKNALESKKISKSSTRETSTDRTTTIKKKKEGEEKSKTSVSKSTVIKNVPSTSKLLEKTKITSPKVGSKSNYDISKTSTSNTKIKGSLTTPHSRVVRQPYFPSKNLYSNAQKATTSEVTTNLDSSKSTNVSTRNTSDNTSKLIKIKKDIKSKKSKEDSSSEASTISERPRTATLRKPSIVNANIVGPEAPKSKIKKVINKNESNFKNSEEKNDKIEKNIPKSPNNSDQYESDFDSYESDFEKYSSSNDSEHFRNISGEETSSISSGADDNFSNISKPPSPSVSSTKTPISLEDERKLDSGTFDLADFKYRHMLDNIKESIDHENSKIIPNNHPSLSDEGFEDQKSLQFINFADAQKKCENKKKNALRKKRGIEILSMIRLDYVNFTIFDLPLVSYDEFIKNYGNSNSIQTSVQTGEDNISEEAQTDIVVHKNKWTQMPVIFTTKFDENCDSNFWNLYKAEYLGIGTDEKSEKNTFKTEFDHSKLLRFLNTSVDLVLNILAEENIKKIRDIKENKRDLPFSDGFLEFNTTQNIFKDTKLQHVELFSKNTNKFLSVHVNTLNTESFNSIICIWDISNYETPQHFFVSFGKVMCCTLSTENSEYIFAGEEDGSVLVWDTKEKCKYYDILNRTPTIRTGVDRGHCTKVVAIKSFQSNFFTGNGVFEISKSNEICSLDLDGTIIIWNLFIKHDPKSSLVLLKTEKVNLQTIFPEIEDVQCTDMILDKNDIYISTNYGDILHYSIDGARCKVKKFSSGGDFKSESTCLDLCPFSPAYFVSGYANGNLSLHLKTSKNPLKVLSNRDDLKSASIQMVHWSKTKPFVLFAKDLKNVLHIWDLSKSEIYPEFSIPFVEKITSLKLSPVLDIGQQEVSYMVISTENGKIYLHILNKSYGQENFESYKRDVATFLNYVSRL